MINYYLRGSSFETHASDWEGPHSLNALISSAENLNQNAGCPTYIVGVDYETKKEHLVWHHAVGRVPHQHRFIRIENIVEGM